MADTPNVAERHRRRWDRTGLLALHKAHWGSEFDVGGRPQKPFEEAGAVAVVSICGPLYQRRDPWGWWDSYEEIEERARAAFESPSKKVLLRIDSPGGDAAGCFELSRALRAMSEESGKELITYVDGMCASAAYAIATASSRIVAPPTSSVGSIGVFEASVDVTAADKMNGVKVNMRASGKRKLDGNPHVETSEDALAFMQEKVDLLAGLFFDLVAEMRGVEASAVEGLEGALLLALQAKEAGLIDSLEVYAALVESLQKVPEETSKMPTKAQATAALAVMAGFMAAGPKAKATDKEWEALKTLAESDDEENRKAASKMLKRMMGGDGDGDESEEDKKAKAEADEKEKKDKEEAESKAKAEQEQKDAEAKALAANGLKMAEEIATLKAQAAARDAADAKAKAEAAFASLFATRPDLSESQRTALRAVPFEQAKAIVEAMPRVSASATAAAAAMTPGAVRDRADAGETLTPEQQALIAKLDGGNSRAKAAVNKGTTVSVPIYDAETARKRLAEKGQVA